MLASVRQLRLAIALSVLGAAALCEADPCRIMPLGNSITGKAWPGTRIM